EGGVGVGTGGRNNCYNYALDLLTTGESCKKLQPGAKNGHTLAHPFTCADVTKGATADGLQESTKDARCPDGCWKVALVLASPQDEGPNGDFHWYRQDDGGGWSHKPDGGDATNKDEG